MHTVLMVLAWVFGVAVALVVAYLLFIAFGMAVVFATGREPPGITVEVQCPPACRVGETIELLVRIRNSLDRARRLYSVDIGAQYLKGLVVSAIDPAPVRREDTPILGTWIHRFNLEIPPNGEQQVCFRLAAAREADCAGDITVYVDSRSFRYIDMPLRTLVNATE